MNKDLVRKLLASAKTPKGSSKVFEPTDVELEYFLEVCKTTGLNPITKQIYPIYRAGKLTIITGIDGLRSIAEKTGRYGGSSKVEYEYDLSTTGAPTNSKKLIGASIKVYKVMSPGFLVETEASVIWSEYYDDRSPMHKAMPHVMAGKIAEALALRKAFPNCGQVYIEEEMQKIDQPTRPAVDAAAIAARVDQALKDKGVENA